MTELLTTIINSETMSQLTVAALAIHLHEMKHDGALPDSLAALVPDHLDRIPVDPFDGQPLWYRLEGDGYVLYSVGLNGIDDGGDARRGPETRRRSPMYGRDVVWPRAAKEVSEP